MARGYIYHIVTDPDNLGNMSASNFYEDIDALCVEFVEDSDPAIAAQNTNSFASMLANSGFLIRPDTDSESQDREVAAFILETGGQHHLDECRKRYFKPLLDALKQEVASMDLDTFVSERCNTYSLKSKINDDYGDAVYLDTTDYGGVLYTMHEFIRGLEPNMVYYVAQNTVLMH